MNRTFEIVTLGCKVNEYETRYYQEQLELLGLKERKADDSDNSDAESIPQKPTDLIVINTCTVTNTAAAKSRKKIRKARKENPDAIVVITGCYAQVAGYETLESLDADLVIGSSHKSEFTARIREIMENKGWPQREEETLQPASPETRMFRFEVSPIEEIRDFDNMPIGHFEHQHRAFLKIQDGCNQYCAYCQIPLARGPERSQIPEKVVETAKMLADSGHLELVLTGIHTGRYSFRNTDLSGLMRMLLDATDENVTFRISSIEITEVTDELISLMKENPRILPHLHIPIQSGCDMTLRRMKRPYTVDQFCSRIEMIRKEIPEISISTDVIVGFVQESDEEFEMTRKTLEKIGFSFLHVFPYSRREGTAADQMNGFVDAQTAHARTKDLLKLSEELRKKDMLRFENSKVLLEREETGHCENMLGYTEQYHPAKVLNPLHRSGRIPVRILRIEDGIQICEEIQR